MRRDEVTAVPADVVDRVLRDPQRFLEEARRGAPGWAGPYSGPEGVAQVTSVILTELAEMTRSAGELRTAAVALLRTHHRLRLAEIAEQLRISPQAVRKISIRPEDADDGKFKHLRTPGGWAPVQAGEGTVHARPGDAGGADG